MSKTKELDDKIEFVVDWILHRHPLINQDFLIPLAEKFNYKYNKRTTQFEKI